MDRLIIYIITVLLLGACSMGGTITLSEPIISSTDQQFSYEDGVLQLEGISISLKPRNYTSGVLTAGPLIFPIIPLDYSGETERAGQNFEIVIQFDPTMKNFEFSPGNVELHIDNNILKPILVAGPVTNIYDAREHNASIPGHPWICDAREHSFVEPTSLPSNKVIKGCFFLHFNTKTVSPAEEFSVQVNGLTRHGVEVKVPTFQFIKSNRGVFFLLM